MLVACLIVSSFALISIPIAVYYIKKQINRQLHVIVNSNHKLSLKLDDIESRYFLTSDGAPSIIYVTWMIAFFLLDISMLK